MDHKFVEDVLDQTRPGWRDRRQRRKSPWNLLCVVLGFGLLLPFWYGLFRLVWVFHVWFHPTHAGRLREFWQANLSLSASVASFLMAIPLSIPAMTSAFLLGNLVVWLIPAARRAMEAEANGDREMTFIGSQMGLIRWGGAASAVSLAASFVGALALYQLR